MKFSKQWLCEILGTDWETPELVVKLTMLGLEVDAIHPAAGLFTDVVVGEVIAAEQHPDATRLRCCKVKISDNDILDIVCGGVNARVGIKVACAKVGAELPSGLVITEAKLRGQLSHGMICSSSELGLEGGSDPEGGIMELPSDAPVGVCLREYLQLDDDIIDIELTPNRGDCASLWGVAREVAVVDPLPFSRPESEVLATTSTETVAVSVSAAQYCPRYVGRVINDICLDAISPLWLQERLRRSDLRCIHPVVDVMNYVMLECGQPLHAFDLDRVSAAIEVRLAKPDEKTTLLNDEEYKLNDKTLVIADQERVLAVAGIMGGLDSGVTGTTTRLFLESAFFDPLAIRRTSSTLNLQSDSSYRFERGVDYNLQREALERATKLIVDICGGEIGPVIEQIAAEHLPSTKTIELRRARISRVLGMSMSDQEVMNILDRLMLQPEATAQGWQVVVPSFRFDLDLEVDLIEELARVHGYDAIPLQNQAISAPMVPKTESMLTLLQFKQHLLARGYNEMIAYSFIEERWQQAFSPNTQAIKLTNPISKDLAVMRTTLWPSLVSTMQYNQNRQLSRVRLFEFGRTYCLHDDEIEQPMMLSMLAVGSVYPEQWAEEKRDVDFFDVKNDVESLLSLCCRPKDFHWEPAVHPALHPGQTAALFDGDIKIGSLGALHPSLVAELDLIKAPVLFEADWSSLVMAEIPSFKPISKFPAMRRDLAVVVADSVTAGEILNVVQQAAGQLLTKGEIFDIYHGEGIESGQKSVALGLTFQDPSRTLVDSEVDLALGGVVTSLQQRFNATMRS